MPIKQCWIEPRVILTKIRRKTRTALLESLLHMESPLKIHGKPVENLWTLGSTCKELSEITDTCTDAVGIDNGFVSSFSFKTRIGKSILRKLYYCLLSNQIPPGKIAATIKSILKAFFPALDTDLLALPKERCAGQMRIDEMCIISEAHKASVICEQLQAGKTLHLNTDGTTLAQKKITASP